MTRAPLALCALLLCAAAVCPQRAAAEPVTAVRCFDGDTCRVLRAGASETTPVRLTGIDAPEIRARCPAEKAGALAARDRLRALVAAATHVELVVTGEDRHWRRVVGRLLLDGVDAGAQLVAEGLAVATDPAHPQPGKWC